MKLSSWIPKLLLFILALVLWVPVSWSASPFESRFDPLIQKASDRWLPGVPWRLYKAQLWQESRLKPGAVSPVGAEGVAQFMPGTWSDVSAQLDLQGKSPSMAGPAIEAGAYYMARLRRSWYSQRPEYDRHSLALASYNAGLGNLVKAQQICDGEVLWQQIAPCLPRVTGHHAQETLQYVPNIWRFYKQMTFLD